MEKISWTDGAKIEELLHRAREESNILRATKQRKTIWTGHILRKNCLLKHVKESQKRRGDEKRRKQLLDELKAGGSYGNFKEKVLHHYLWRICLLGPIARETKQYVSQKPDGRIQ